ncbi:MAG: hypothetical protein EDS66_16415 [Planctomycetota bacterium]|nr:MAG: hypothetical protein EDS66_16415 [Planctomycetota bacterium]MCQ3922538.1 hypothetical protein [Planctomycetota bacterium]
MDITLPLLGQGEPSSNKRRVVKQPFSLLCKKVIKREYVSPVPDILSDSTIQVYMEHVYPDHQPKAVIHIEFQGEFG